MEQEGEKTQRFLWLFTQQCSSEEQFFTITSTRVLLFCTVYLLRACVVVNTELELNFEINRSVHKAVKFSLSQSWGHFMKSCYRNCWIRTEEALLCSPMRERWMCSGLYFYLK